jgi:LPXTG-motif cell wall-anchored protein
LDIKLETPATPVDTVISIAPAVSTEVLSETPTKTGDDNNFSFYVGLLVISMGAMVILKKKKSNFLC